MAALLWSPWRCQRAIDGPTVVVDSHQDRLPIDASVARPVGGNLGLALKLNQAGHPSIAGLLSDRSPSHIARLVVTVTVDAIDGVLRRWWLSNVSQERFKAVYPVVAHTDATATVTRVVLLMRVIAASLDCRPRSVLLRRSMAVFSRSVVAVPDEGLCCAGRRLLVAIASATLGKHFRSKRVSPHSTLCPTRASTKEPGAGTSVTALAFSLANHGPAAKGVTFGNISRIHVVKFNTPGVPSWRQAT